MADLHLHNVSFAYPGSSNPVLHSLNLDIPTGQFVLVAGSSGCGKSTLGLVLAGLIPSRIAGHCTGHVTLGTQNLSRMDVFEASQRVGMVFQNPENQLIHLDVEAEVAFGPENLGLPPEEIEARVRWALACTGMEAHRRSLVYTLSGGQKQRVAVAATLAMRPEVLVLDEPTSDLDPVGTQEVLQVLRLLKEREHMTVILIEHKIDEVIPWVDRVLLMDEGRVVVDAAARDAFADTAIWRGRGVAVPELVYLAELCPSIFENRVPLSVDEAVDAFEQSGLAKNIRAASVLSHTGEAGGPAALRSAEPVISWNRATLSYDGQHRVLDEVSLRVEPGEWLALIGPNGAGKTSLASLAMGLQAPTSGSVACFDHPVRAGALSRQARLIGYLFQSADNMLFAPSVERELHFSARHNAGTAGRSVERMLEVIDLQAHRRMNPFHLSHGQRKRLAIGALLCMGPAAMILDEPTTGQDQRHAAAFLSFLERLRREETLTYVMITHDMRAVASYATRVVVLSEGRLCLQGPPNRVFARGRQLEELGIVPPPIAHLHGRLLGESAEWVHTSVQSFAKSLLLQEVR